MAGDGAGFFPAVLTDPEFVRRGILHGQEPGHKMPLQWSIIDPHRHVMFVWRKTTTWLNKSATRLGSSVFTNGPFTSYPYGSMQRSAMHFGIGVAQLAGGMLRHPGSLRTLPEAFIAVQERNFRASTTLGFVLGAREGIDERQVARPRVHWFGRGSNHDFDSYRIADGDPPMDAAEAVGGLYRGVRDYKPYTIDQVIRVGYWALAPLVGDDELERHGVAAALEAYRGQVGAAPTGLVLVLAGHDSTQRMTHLLSQIRARDAVQFDGSSNLLLGHGNTIRIGRRMPPYRQVIQCWGVQFQPASFCEVAAAR